MCGQAARDLVGSPLFASTAFGMNISLAWWIVLTLVAAYVLSNTRFGNWILHQAETGKRPSRWACRSHVGVRALRHRRLASMLVGVLSMIHVDRADVVQGQEKSSRRPLLR